MKITQANEFQPITIVLEDRKEAEHILEAVMLWIRLWSVGQKWKRLGPLRNMLKEVLGDDTYYDIQEMIETQEMIKGKEKD